MSEILEISDDENDSVENSITEDEDTPVKQEINKKAVQNIVNSSVYSNEESSSVNFKKQKLIKALFPTFKENPPKMEHTTPKKLYTKTISGVNVKLPIEPYGCQVALMSRIIASIKKSENCLLESPTGTGKTLAILCATLAWQQQEQEEQNRIIVRQLAESMAKENHVTGLESPLKKMQNLTTATTPEKLFNRPVFGEKSIYDPMKDAGDYSNSNMKRKWEERETPPENLQSKPGLVTIHKRANLDTGVIDLTAGPSSPTPGPSKPLQTTNGEETPQPKRIPTIYYGSRTHKQLEQVIKEFGTTHYCGGTTMAILSSRDHSCIRPFDRRQWPSKDDMCRGCVKNYQPSADARHLTDCRYFERRTALTHDVLPPTFSLERLVAAGREHKACPYYAARTLAQRAKIVFCPYNYLIDPAIRKSMQINLKDLILIIDEAHNIEEVCRAAATFVVDLQQIDAATKELTTASNYRFANSAANKYIEFLKVTLDRWGYWFRNQIPLVEQAPIKYGKAVFTWPDIKVFVTTLNNHEIGATRYPEFSQCVQQLCKQFMDDPRTLIGITQATCTLLEAMETTLGYLFGDSGKFMDDFVSALIKKESEHKKERAVSLHVLCMRGRVVFAPLCAARSVLLASGTLPPRALLAAELGAAFRDVSLQHVVPEHQVWAGVVEAGPGAPLTLGWQAARDERVQDALGRTLLRAARLTPLRAARLTPHGVLCFLPSYPLLRDLRRRWERTDIWKSLNDAKHVYVESQNASEHNEIMKLYYEKALSAKGALLLGVYRGKVAEGMDFRDDQARLVVAVGIPYPNLDDVAVLEKKKYNDLHVERGLPSGADWYHAQAFRALGQALGRCVRHRADWGGVLLLDRRYAQRGNLLALPAWLRNPLMKKRTYSYEGLEQDEDSLKTFMENMTLSSMDLH
ncbi:LOW QUALITY PROTEIN: Fanconi anemia group J protein-like [Epargyreus clarus]|uniref:LOW QUALITY PROTEIN: Fanconi anemia group J protein-like n=1 Tax=Epargyreus clarus TaxID=520877 RepID=UPI003C2CD2AE